MFVKCRSSSTELRATASRTKKLTLRLFSAITLILVMVLASLSPADIVGTGDLPGGAYVTMATGISADGSTVVGRAEGDNGTEAFRRTRTSGLQGLGDFAGGDFYSVAYGISADGSTIVGRGSATSGTMGFRWTSSGGMQEVGDLAGGAVFSIARDVSADGSAIVGETHGLSGREAFRWTNGGGIQGLGHLGSPGDSIARGISGDGSMVIGVSNLTEALLWTETGGMQSLGGSEAFGISYDGSTIVGAGGLYGFEAVRWQNGGTAQGLGHLDAGYINSKALAVSGDGSAIVGVGFNVIDGNQAFYYTDLLGMQSLEAMLLAQGDDLSQWRSLQTATGISSDGRTITGWGFNALGHREAYVARLSSVPEPSSLSILGLCCVGSLLRRRKRWA